MANLRLTRVLATDSKSIRAQFTQNLDTAISASNVSITAVTVGIPDPEVVDVNIINNIIYIDVLPLTPYAFYDVEFKSTRTQRFKSADGSSYLFEDGKTNVSRILGPSDNSETITQILQNYLKRNGQSIYNVDIGTLINDFINAQGISLSKALHDVRQARSDNWLEVVIFDELKTRGTGPWDRLNEEGAFEVIRVGKNQTSENIDGSISYTVFPRSPVTLQKVQVNRETLVAGTGVSTFDGLIFTVANSPVIKLNRLIVNYQAGGSADYPISTYGYQLKNARYDTEKASTYLLLEDNQIKISDEILGTSFDPPAPGDTVYIYYDYKHEGKIIDANSVQVTQVLDATREVVPPILTSFSLQHFPIVTSADIVAVSGGVSFLDPQSNPPFSATHPAFIKEITYRVDSPPAAAGEYAVNYNTGNVLVYGESIGQGSGDFPPVATYKYRKSFSSRLDYTYDPDTYELVASPLRDLAGQAAKISFKYEMTYIPDVDFVAQVHKESIDERIENRLATLTSLYVSNSPITNVFRIFNETSGEIYPLIRFTDNTVYFNYNTAPRIVSVSRERAAFTDVLSETLLIDREIINALSVRVFKIFLSNQNIISSTEDCIGSSFNSSVSFSRTDVFQTELYYDGQTADETDNINRLTVGAYQVNYTDGIVYVGVSNAQLSDIGTINYKEGIVFPQNKHLISVSDIYYSISNISGIAEHIGYTSFEDQGITPAFLDISDERFLNGDTHSPYIVDSGTITVTDDIKTVRGVFDHYDLTHNIIPTDFGVGSTVSANVITLPTTGVEKKETYTLSAPGNVINVAFLTSGAGVVGVTSVLRVSDNTELWDSGGTFSGYTITLSGVGVPVTGQTVVVTYNVGLNGGATPIVDYNRGDYFIDYNYLADEILVSYEYGDNRIDFRQSSAIESGSNYYVTYKIGALRDSLLNNFGTLVDVPVLNSFDINLNREIYRHAMQGSLQSFTKGPTIPSMKLLVSSITRIEPQIIEAVFDIWSLGVSNLFLDAVDYSDDIQLMSGKFDNGLLQTEPDQTVTFPVSSNLKVEEGTLECWVIPEWDGLDNDATLTFSDITRDGYDLPVSNIFIGADSHHPDGYTFSLNRIDDPSPIGLPSAVYTSIGVFIYYDDTRKRWYLLAKDAVDGYVSHIYNGKVVSSGEVYDVKFMPDLGEVTDTIRSFKDKIEFSLHLDGYDFASPDGYTLGDGYIPGYSFDGITWMADDQHYIFDFGKDEAESRFSIYKDGRGYLNFEVFDNGESRSGKHEYKVSADISSWLAGQKHHVATAWKINSSNRRDEMHLFIDGLEVPNIMKYGGIPEATSTDRFRTVKPEYVVGLIPSKIITAADLHTTAGSTSVFSDSIDFTLEGIVPGDSIQILETGFATYTILVVSGHSLQLNLPAPISFTDARFSVNPYSVVVATNVDLYANITVSLLRGSTEIELPGLRADIPGYAISKNALLQNVLEILGDAEVGDQIVIRTLGLNNRRVRDKIFLWGDITSILKTQLPPPINLDTVIIVPVVLPLTPIGLNNSIVIGGRFFANGLSATQVSNQIEGRRLSVRVTGGNVDFTTAPVLVTINGSSTGGPTEVLSFGAPGTQITTNKWQTITSVDVGSTPYYTTRDSTAVEIKEAYSIIYPDGNTIYPIIRFSFKTQSGLTLEGDGSTTVSDPHGSFIDSDVGNKLVISSPAPVVGTYNIVSRNSATSIEVSPATGTAFTNGIYDIYDVSIGRSGFQNGFFTFEPAGSVDGYYNLPEGVYEFDYPAWLEIPFDHTQDMTAYVGTDMFGNKPSKAVIDEFRTLSFALTDTRVGESIADNEYSVTTDYNSLRPFESNNKTLMLLHFDNLPLVNSAQLWKSYSKEFIQSVFSVNSNFDQCVVINERSIIYDNEGILSTVSGGTIEFWVSPIFDTYNDPLYRFYFDAAASLVEQATSITKGSVQTSSRISSVNSVRLASDVDNTGVNYFDGGFIESDFRTIRLGRALPAQNTPVKIDYIQAGLAGDRISIFKDNDGFINFNVRASGTDYQVRQPIFWARDSWHRIMATYKINSPDNRDEVRLFVDGEERGTVLYGSGLIYGTGVIYGQGRAGQTAHIIADINLHDPINKIYLGSDYLQTNLAQARIDNLKISNSPRAPLVISGQAKDINYNSNTDAVLPVVEDLYTIFLENFDTDLVKQEDMAILRDEFFGIFNFELDIIDSFGIVIGNSQVTQILEDLIYALKPAQSKVTINYFD